MPFLIELVAEPRVEEKEGILRLLASIAEGSSFIDVHAGVFDRMGSGPRSEQERAEREAHLRRELGWVRAAYEAVEAGVSTYLDLLADADSEVRIFAAYTLGHCQGALRRSSRKSSRAFRPRGTRGARPHWSWR